jgi:8-oxo-dGTP diphosphatase
MKFEFSAGGILYKKSPKGVDILLCQNSYHHGWGFPKGLIGDHIEGEGKEETALREVEEETGAKGEILEALDAVTYWYKFNEEKIKKTVYYFIMKYTEGDITKHDFEMENVEWVDIDKVLDKLSFASDKEVFQKAMPRIQSFVDRD